MITLVLIVVLVPSLVVASYPFLIRRMFAKKHRLAGSPGDARPSQALSIIVPCRGLEERPTENIDALLGQRFSVRTEILFCVESIHDPVAAVLQPLLRARPDGAARLVVTGAAGEDLGKMHNLLGGYAEASGDRLVFLDSDVLLPDAEYLNRFVSRLDQPDVGLVTCYPAYRDFRNIPAAVTAFMINNDLLGLFAVVGARDDLSVANGSCMAVDRAALEASGGLKMLRRQLLMDTVLARNILQAGYRVRIHGEAAPVVAGRMTFAEMRQQSRRWHAGMWRVLPRLHYLGFALLRAGFLMGVTACVLLTPDPALAVALAFYLTARFLVSSWLDRRYLQSGSFLRYWWLLPLVELLNGWDSLTAPLVREVGWRGRAYRADHSGR